MISGTSRRHAGLKASTEGDSSVTGDIIQIIEDEDRLHDLNISHSFKRSGTHNLDRIGYHEEKCRNVLVRYCAHIPRNYQYKDGIPQIFLILREHLGDENLDLAGGVLYELIEVDCEHTDDPGAAFQRWKHDHLRRYADLELPHVPHMTTITSSIIPTKKLAQWRLEHPGRYPFVLSDSSPSTERASIDPSCIRNRKAWLIDHTLYISSRNDGTRPLNSPNPQKFHEMQWSHECGTQGKFIEERDVPIASPDRPSATSPPGTADTLLLDNPKPCKGLRGYSSRSSLFSKLSDKIHMHKHKPELDQRRCSWIPGALTFEPASSSSFRTKRTCPDVATVPLPSGCQIPNAIFARKYLLVGSGDSLPPCLPLRQMPTAESKATDTIVKAASTGLLERTRKWSFRGPFTPQLNFDGGLDYQWSPDEPTINCERFDLNDSIEGTSTLQFGNRFEGSDLEGTEQCADCQRISTKRQGIVFNLEEVVDGDRDTAQLLANYTTSNRSALNSLGETIPRGFDTTTWRQLQSDEPSTLGNQGPSTLLDSNHPQLSSIQERNRHGLRRCDSLLFKNVEFTMPAETSGAHTSTSNRKTTIIELSPSLSPPEFNEDDMHRSVMAEEGCS
ncbi:hypothetical protein F5Y00DRAFT_260784 [Daldinia vernicosa]|uniref:uncharacterized protein n=1 Tax=Daldinia vernicosa TaxID=114800 RepID=UPI002007D478|nr:uncharacterized protein F5Y00DRAFT_260784 [Daldinia vernicosa]KAI0850052.1 hypothetical protein F5Y00DRAFT_260784 [Daldinia vernicosa]